MLFLLGLCVCEVTSNRDTNDLGKPASCVRRKRFPGREGAAAQALAGSGAGIITAPHKEEQEAPVSAAVRKGCWQLTREVAEGGGGA